MRSIGVDLVEYNIDKDKSRRDELQRKVGRTSVPVFDIDGTIIQGFNQASIQAALDRGSR